MKYTRQVERVDAPNTKEKPVQFTHLLSVESGWVQTTFKPSEFERVVYLGDCKHNVDMFASYTEGGIYIFKGHLNSGRY